MGHGDIGPLSVVPHGLFVVRVSDISVGHCDHLCVLFDGVFIVGQ